MPQFKELIKLSIKKILSHLGIIFIAFFLTVIFTFPFITKLKTYYNDGSDYAVNGFIVSYNYNSLLSGKVFNQEKYFNGQQFYPQPYTLTYSDHRFIPSIIFAPFYYFTHDLILSVNILTFLSFVFSFISSFYVINFFVKNKLASIIGAIVFTFNPITFVRFPVHLDLLSKYFLPPLFFYFYQFLKIPKLRNSFYFFLFFTLNALTVIYYQIFSIVIIGAIFCSLFIYKIIKKQFSYILNIIKLSFISLLFLPFLIYFDKPYLDFSNEEMVQRSINVSIFLSARLIDWFMPSPGSVVYGDFVRSLDTTRSPKDPDGNFAHGEHTLGLNILPMVLFFLSILYFINKNENKDINFTKKSFLEILRSKRNTPILKIINRLIKFPYLFFLVVLILSFFLTLGPYFTGWNNSNGLIKLPYYYLYDISPLLKGIRVPSRAQFIFYVPFSLFISFGALYLLQRIKKNSIFLTILMILILLLENYHGGDLPSTSKPLQQFKDLNYKNQLLFLSDKKVLHHPTFAVDFNNTSTFGSEIYYLNWATQTGEILMNGNSGYFPEDQINFLGQIKKALSEDSLKKLISLNIDYLIIHKDLFDKKDLSNYENNKKLLKQGLIWENQQIEIIDLKKININPRICNFEKDFEVRFVPVTIQEINKTILATIIKNKSDCYLASIYKNRYKILDFYTNFIHHQAQIKLPIIIGPYEEVTISELTSNLKIKN